MTTMTIQKSTCSHKDTQFIQADNKFFNDRIPNYKRSTRYGYSDQEKRIQKYGLANHLAYEDLIII